MNGIEDHSAGLRAGLKTELQAARYLVQKGWSIKASDITVNRVQIDLLARSPEGLQVIVEVKSEASTCFGVLSHGQLKRLKRAQLCLCSHEPTLLLVLVENRQSGFIEIPIED